MRGTNFRESKFISIYKTIITQTKTMRKSILSLCIVATLFIVTKVNAQEFPDLDASPMDVAYYPDRLPYADLRSKEITAPQIKIYYTRPQLKGRKMIGEKAVEYGKMWRMGANEANEIHFYQDVNIGGTSVAAGTYSIFVIPVESKWTFVLYNKLNVWGHYTLTDDDKEVARVEGTVTKSDETIEAMSIMFKEVNGTVNLMLGWENTIASMPIKF